VSDGGGDVTFSTTLTDSVDDDDDYIDDGTPDDPSPTPDQQQTSAPQDPCPGLAAAINKIINAVRGSGTSAYKGLAQRFAQLRGLPASELSGHIEQIQNMQRQLQKQLQQWKDDDCGPPPPGAEEWATKPIPTTVTIRLPAPPNSNTVNAVGWAAVLGIILHGIGEGWPIIFAF
jgi:hypothetical protein